MKTSAGQHTFLYIPPPRPHHLCKTPFFSKWASLNALSMKLPGFVTGLWLSGGFVASLPKRPLSLSASRMKRPSAQIQFWAETKYLEPKDALYITLSGDPNPSNSIHLHVGMYSKTKHLPTSLKKGNLHFWKSLKNIQ